MGHEKYSGDDYDAFYDLAERDKWAIAMERLRAKPESLLEFKPDNWGHVRFGHNLSMLDLQEYKPPSL